MTGILGLIVSAILNNIILAITQFILDLLFGGAAV